MPCDVICIRMVEAEACSFGGKMRSKATQKNSFLIIATPYNESLDSIVPVILRSIRPFRGQDRVKQTSFAKFHDHL